MAVNVGTTLLTNAVPFSFNNRATLALLASTGFTSPTQRAPPPDTVIETRVPTEPLGFSAAATAHTPVPRDHTSSIAWEGHNPSGGL